MAIFKPWNYGETFLIQPDPKEWLPEYHEAYFVAELIIKLAHDTPVPLRDPEIGGRPAFNPMMMLIVMVFAYLRGVRSSRKINRLLIENIAFKILACDQKPNFRTLCRFRAFHSAWFEKMLTRTIHVGMVLRIIDFSAVIVDGTPIQASANQGKSLTLEGLTKVREEELLDLAAARAKAMMAEAAEIDAKEDQVLGDDIGPNSMLKGLTSERLGRLDDAIAKAKALEMLRLRKEGEARAAILRKAVPGKKARKRVKGTRGRKLSKEERRSLLSRLSKIRVPKHPKVNYTDPDSLTLKAKNGGFNQAYQVVRATELHSGMILVNHLSPSGGESRELPAVVEKTLEVTGMPELLRVLADKGYSGEPNLKQVKGVFQLLIAQKVNAKSPLVKTQIKLNNRKRYWMKKRGIGEGSNAGTKEARGFRRFFLRRRGGVAIELMLDAIAHNLMKLRSKISKLTEPKLSKALINAAMCGA